MYSSTLSLTLALDGVGGHRHTPTVLPPAKTRYPLYRRLGGPQRRSGQVRKISPSSGFDPRTVQPVASRHTDWDIAARYLLSHFEKSVKCREYKIPPRLLSGTLVVLPSTFRLLVKLSLTGYSGSRTAALVLNVSAWLRLVVNFTSCPLYPRERTRNPLNTRLGGPQSQSGRFR